MSQSNMRSRIRRDGSVEEVPPERCPAGHPRLPHGTLVGWSPCDCTPGVHGHRTYTCRYVVNRAECGLVLSFPPAMPGSVCRAVVVDLINLSRSFLLPARAEQRGRPRQLPANP